tara:strand:+ start:257 stop:643 length:387 start_codon:yes stop_codon:yes gene_type:complete
MVGVIWVIQLVHYPSFHFIDKDIYDSFQKFHMNKISIIVIPVMILELVTGFLLLIGNSKNILIIISFGILILIWGITGLFFSDAHGKLILGYNELIVNKLVSMNWIRTVLWTFKMILLLYLSYAYSKI